MIAQPCTIQNPDYYQAVLDSLPNAMFTIDRDFVITSFNRSAEQLTGVNRTRALGQHCYEVMRNQVCEHVTECPLKRVYEGLACTCEIMTIRPPDGHYVPVRVLLHPLRDAQGQVIGGIETIERLDASYTVSEEPSDALPILAASQRRAIQEVLARHNWNRSTACHELGISRTTLWRKMRKLGISDRPPK